VSDPHGMWIKNKTSHHYFDINLRPYTPYNRLQIQCVCVCVCCKSGMEWHVKRIFMSIIEHGFTHQTKPAFGEM